MQETDFRATDTGDTVAVNRVVNFHYRLAEVDGDGNCGPWFEQSYGGEPICYPYLTNR